MEIPEAIRWWRREPEGAAWLDRLPALVERCAARWGLSIGPPFPGGIVALTLAATRDDGREVVLKLCGPDPESAHEPDALLAWDGRGAVRLLDRDDDARALLLERLLPGDALIERGEDETIDVVAGILHELHEVGAPGRPFARLSDVARGWAEMLPERWEGLGRPFEEELLDVAVATCLAPPPADAPTALLHQDLHAGNVLRDGDGWRSIDPKPLVGEAAFDGAAILRDRHWALPREELERVVQRRLDRLAAASGYDRERLRRWGIAHTLAWGVDAEAAADGMTACARALLRAP